MSIFPAIPPTLRDETAIKDIFTQSAIDVVVGVTEPTFKLGAVFGFGWKAGDIFLEMGGTGWTGIDFSKGADELADGILMGLAGSLGRIICSDCVKQGPSVSAQSA